MHLRELTENDVPGIFDVRTATIENPFSREALRSIGITENSVRGMLKTSHRGWVCEVAGRIVGFSMIDATSGEIWVVAVLPAFEDRGIGSRLLALAEDCLWALGKDELWLWTAIEPTRAYHLYLKRGWQDSQISDGKRYMKKKRRL